jgi:hypothetical protein
VNTYNNPIKTCSDENYSYQGINDYRFSKQVTMLEELAKEIIKSKGDVFKIRDERRGEIDIYCDNKSILMGLNEVLSSGILEDYESKQKYLSANPYANILLHAIDICKIRDIALETTYDKDIHGYEWDLDAYRHLSDLNSFIEYIRELAKEKDVRRVIRNFQRNTDNAVESACWLIDQLFQRHGRLLVIRIDLSYRAEFNESHSPEVLYEQAKADREHLFENIRSNHTLFGDAYLGYIWKLEFGLYKKFHYHFVFFFNEAKVSRDIYKAIAIGDYWNSVITRGNGAYFNCNAKKGEYQYLGIGAIDYYDVDAVANLKRVMLYLAKPDHTVKMFVNAGDRIFGRSEPDEFSKIPGRPREYPMYQPSFSSRQGYALTRSGC